MTILVRRYSATHETLPVLPTITAAPWPSGFATAPAAYRFGGYPAPNNGGWDLSHGGLYSLDKSSTVGNWVLVPGALLDTLRGLSWCCTWGTYDDLDALDRLAIWTDRVETAIRLEMHCGYLCQWAAHILAGPPIGYQVRTLRWLSLPPYAGDDFGHVTLEVRDSPTATWTVFDPSAGRCWPGGLDFVRGPAVQLRPEIPPSQPYPRGSPLGGAGHQNAVTTYSRDTWEDWTDRVMVIPGIDHGGLTYWGLRPEHAQHKAAIEALAPTYRGLAWSAFQAMFY